MEYVTIEGVELAAVGMEWHAASGDEAFTFENLADAVEAANNDPHIVSPRIRLGHTSDLNHGEGYDPFEELGDAVPAFGTVTNLRLTNDGAMLVGDFVEVPEWLAEAIPSAYPTRSIQARRMVTTEGSKTYSMVLTAVSLLGPIEPAVKTLDDLERLLVEGPDVEAATNPNPEEGPMPETVAASVDVNTIRERFNFDWAMSEPVDGLDTYYWWAISVRVDPAEVIAEDEEGQLWSVSWSTDGKNEITFGEEPKRVREEFVPVEATATAVVASFRERKKQKVLANHLPRPEKPDKPAASSQPDPQEEETMPDIDMDKLRSRLGLPDDATEEQINEALAADPEAEPTGEGAPDGEASGENEPSPEGEQEPTGEPVAAAADRGVTVDKDALAQLKSDAAAGREAREEQLKSARAAFLSQAVQDGKFPPAAKAAYAEQLAKGGDVEASTRKFIDELPKNTVPVSASGETGDGGEGVTATAGLPNHWFKELNDNGDTAKEDE